MYMHTRRDKHMNAHARMKVQHGLEAASLGCKSVKSTRFKRRLWVRSFPQFLVLDLTTRASSRISFHSLQGLPMLKPSCTAGSLRQQHCRVALQRLAL